MVLQQKDILVKSILDVKIFFSTVFELRGPSI